MSSFTAGPWRWQGGQRRAAPCPRLVGGHAALCPPYEPCASIHLLDEHPDRAAAGQPDFPGRLVGNAELDRLRLAARDHIERLGHHRALDAAARDAPKKVAFIVDHQI